MHRTCSCICNILKGILCLQAPSCEDRHDCRSRSRLPSPYSSKTRGIWRRNVVISRRSLERHNSRIEQVHRRSQGVGLLSRPEIEHSPGKHRFAYLTPRVRITPRDLAGTKLEHPKMLHFICSPKRASEIMAEVREVPEWSPTTVYEPIPVRIAFICIHCSM